MSKSSTEGGSDRARSHALQLTLSANCNDSSEIMEEKVEVEVICRKPDNNRHRRSKRIKSYMGIILTLMSTLMTTFISLIIKHLYKFQKFSIGFFRCQGVLFPSLVLLVYFIKKHYFRAGCDIIDKNYKRLFDSLTPVQKKWRTILALVGRGINGTTGFLFHIFALHYVTIADAVTISSCAPVVVTIWAHFLLNEKAGLCSMISALLTVFGIVTIARPPILFGSESYDADTLIGCGLSLITLAAMSMSLLLLRTLKHVHYSLTMFSFGVWGTLISGISAFLFYGEFQVPETREEIVLLGAIAICSFSNQFFITMALQLEQTSVVSIAKSSGCIFAFILQYVFLGIVPDIYSIFGGTLVFIGIILVGVRKIVLELPERSPIKQNALRFHRNHNTNMIRIKMRNSSASFLTRSAPKPSRSLSLAVLLIVIPSPLPPDNNDQTLRVN